MFLHHFHWCHSTSELSLLFVMFITLHHSHFAPLSQHVYFSSIMVYLFGFQFSYLYCTATSLSEFWGLEIIFEWRLTQCLAWRKSSIALCYRVISDLLHDLYSYFFSWVIQHIFTYHLQDASNPARNGRYNPYSKVICSLMIKSQVDIQVPYSEEEE